MDLILRKIWKDKIEVIFTINVRSNLVGEEYGAMLHLNTMRQEFEFNSNC